MGAVGFVMRKSSELAFTLGLGLAWSCSAGLSAVDEERVPAGVWGGEHLQLVVTEAGGTTEFDCAHGSLDSPLALDEEGRFDVPGTLVREGGPIREDPQPSQSVRYVGRTNGRSMRIEVVSAAGEGLGAYSVEHGRPAILRKCY
jgi:hypothetical protein